MDWQTWVELSIVLVTLLISMYILAVKRKVRAIRNFHVRNYKRIRLAIIRMKQKAGMEPPSVVLKVDKGDHSAYSSTLAFRRRKGKHGKMGK